MMVIVQLLTANQDPPGEQVGRCIGAVKVPVADVMSQAIHNTGGPDRNPHHLNSPDRQPDRPKRNDVDDQHQGHTPH
ncbi:hypothetical protein SDC9_206807 [bioreactor metagenome]|uniref:Uncharacterized protein n=1 Tax=bioreactor metagenome TaxID=1076179 RepID=A0A645J8R0_9ZZZZ